MSESPRVTHLPDVCAELSQQEIDGFVDAYEALWEALDVPGRYPEYLVFFGPLITAFIDLGMGGQTAVSIHYDRLGAPATNAERLFNRVGKASA